MQSTGCYKHWHASHRCRIRCLWSLLTWCRINPWRCVEVYYINSIHLKYLKNVLWFFLNFSSNAWSIFAKDSWWNELVLTGLFAMGLGIFLIVLNTVISKKEEDDLEAYVQSQLTRSRSGKKKLFYIHFSLPIKSFPSRSSPGTWCWNGRTSDASHKKGKSNSSWLWRARLGWHFKFKLTTYTN